MRKGEGGGWEGGEIGRGREEEEDDNEQHEEEVEERSVERASVSQSVYV